MSEHQGSFSLDQAEIDKNSVIPIYYQLAKFFEKQIRERNLLPGEALPTETEIANHFGISRMTVRRAIAELVAAGLVYAQKGKGTFVAMPKLDNIVFDLNNFYEEIKQKGMELQSKLLEAKIVRSDELLSKRLGIPLNTRCLYFRIVVTVNGEPLAYERKYTVYTKQKPILETELKDPSLSSLAAAHSDSLPVGSKKVLMVSKTTEEESLILGVPRGTPVFVMIQTLYDLEKKPIAWGISIFRGDRYKLVSYDGWYEED